MAKQEYASVLGADAARHVGSTPISSTFAVVAELADALRSGRSELTLVQVQVLSTAQSIASKGGIRKDML